MIEEDDDEDRGEIVSVVEGRGILKRELGLLGGGGAAIAARRANARTTRVLGERVTRPAYSDLPDEEDDDDEGGDNFFVATGHRLWNSISNKVDDLRTDEGEGRGRMSTEDEEGGLLGRIPRPKWLKRGESGVSVWKLPRWGRNDDEGRVVL